MLDKNDLEILVDCIVNSSIKFLEDDILIKVSDISECEHNIEKQLSLVGSKYLAVVSFKDNLEGVLDFFYLITIDKVLLENIFKVMIPLDITEQEKWDMMKLLPAEVVNTVAGLAISKFPQKYENFSMSEPLQLNKQILESFKQNNMTVSKKIATDLGEFICTLCLK